MSCADSKAGQATGFGAGASTIDGQHDDYVSFGFGKAEECCGMGGGMSLPAEDAALTMLHL